MSKSLFVEYRDEGFWAFDVIASVFLKQLVDAAQNEIARRPWLSPTIEQWKVNTILPDCFGIELDEKWTAAQAEEVISLIDVVCQTIERKKEITASEVDSWELLDGKRIFMRGLPAVSTKAVANLGRAIISLLNGTLPPAPDGTWWWYGENDQPGTLKRRYR